MSLANLERLKSEQRKTFVALLGGWLNTRTDPWRGSASDLAEELGCTSTANRDCIPSAKVMASTLVACADDLAKLDWFMSQSRTGHCRTIRFDRTGEKS